MRGILTRLWPSAAWKSALCALPLVVSTASEGTAQPDWRMAVDRTSGGLTAAQVRAPIQRGIEDVQFCYEGGLERIPSMAGQVTIFFLIEPDGRVGESRPFAETLGDPDTAECIAHVAATWTFPRPEPAGVVQVLFPFNLSNDGADEPRRVGCVSDPPGDASTWAPLPAPLPPHLRTTSEDVSFERMIREGTRPVLATYLRDHPDHPSWDRLMYALGDDLARAGRHDRAAQVFHALAERAPRSRFAPYAHAAIGRRAYEEGRYEDARTAFHRAASTGGMSHEIQGYVLTMAAASSVHVCDLEKARVRFEAASRYLGDHPEWREFFLPSDAATFEERRRRAEEALGSAVTP